MNMTRFNYVVCIHGWESSLSIVFDRNYFSKMTDVSRLRVLQTVTLTYTLKVEKGKGIPYSISERRVPELIPVLGSQPAGDVSHNPGGRLPLLSARPAVIPATIKRAATNFPAW